MKEESIGAFSLIDIKIFYVCSLSSGQFTFLYLQTDINNTNLYWNLKILFVYSICDKKKQHSRLWNILQMFPKRFFSSKFKLSQYPSTVFNYAPISKEHVHDTNHLATRQIYNSNSQLIYIIFQRRHILGFCRKIKLLEAIVVGEAANGRPARDQRSLSMTNLPSNQYLSRNLIK